MVFDVKKIKTVFKNISITKYQIDFNACNNIILFEINFKNMLQSYLNLNISSNILS